MKRHALFQGEIITKKREFIDEFKKLLLKNHCANFNQTWHKATFGKDNLSLFKWRATPFPKEDNYETAKIHWRNLKIFFFRTIGLISTKLRIKHPWVKGTQGFTNKGNLIMKMEMVAFLLSKSTLWYNHSVEDLNWFLRWAMWPMGILFILFVLKFWHM